MKDLRAEVEANFKSFTESWKQRLATVTTDLTAQETKYLESYTRLVSLQAWRSELLEQAIDNRSLGFYLEAQNDAVVSHVFARLGAWRSSLKSLRSCIENVMQCLYYKDHPVELTLWHSGDHFLQRTALVSYLQSHPAFRGFKGELTGLTSLGAEYTTLNKAVHGSAMSFRMTTDAESIQLCSSDRSQLGAWGTREKHVVTGVNLLMLAMFRDRLQGAALPNLRKAIALAVPSSIFAEIKAQLGISLPTS